MFALEDHRDGVIFVYLPDISGKAVHAKLLEKSPQGLKMPGTADVFAELVDSTTPEPPIHIKPMLGWNRKAIKLTIRGSEGAESPQVEAAEQLYRRWRQKTGPRHANSR